MSLSFVLFLFAFCRLFGTTRKLGTRDALPVLGRDMGWTCEKWRDHLNAMWFLHVRGLMGQTLLLAELLRPLFQDVQFMSCSKNPKNTELSPLVFALKFIILKSQSYRDQCKIYTMWPFATFFLCFTHPTLSIPGPCSCRARPSPAQSSSPQAVLQNEASGDQRVWSLFPLPIGLFGYPFLWPWVG